MAELFNAQFPAEQSTEGKFLRQEDAFRGWVTADGSSGFPAAVGRYHLYVSWACPWAHRTIIVRRLKHLEDIISLSAVDPIRDELGWAFRDGDGYSKDPINGFQYLSEAYHRNNPAYQGRVTVPVLWDKVSGQIVSNSDDDILRMLNTEFAAFSETTIDLCPANRRVEIDELNESIYQSVNDGVYRAGFATTQIAYEDAVKILFHALDDLDRRLATSRYLFGSEALETDWRLFVSLIRFDPVYHGHFKCNLRRLVDYPNLYGYLRDLYQVKGIAETVNFDHIKRHYYMTHDEINPTRIVPLGPIQRLDEPHHRDRLL